MESDFLENLRKIERDIFKARWIAILGCALLTLVSPPATGIFSGWVVVLGAAIYNAAVGYFLEGGRYRLFLSYATPFLDSIFISLFISLTDGQMPEYAAFYLLPLLSVAIRFGLVETVSMGVASCVLYGLILLARPEPFYFPSFLIHCALLLLAALVLGYFARQVRTWQQESKRREKEMERKITELSVLQEVNRAVHDLQSGDTLRNIVEVATKVLGFERAALFLTDGSDNFLEERFLSVRDQAVLDSADRPWSISPIRLEKELLTALLKRDKPIMVDGSQGSERMAQQAEPLLAIPLHGVGGCLGVLVVDSGNGRPILEKEMDLLMDLASSAVLAIENIQLHNRVQRLAVRDGLTDLYNHRHFQESLREKLKEAHKSGQPVSLVMVEVDRFKDYNDTYGHRRGDEALKSIARALEKSASKWKGIPARYGGDEFVVILPGLAQEEALHAAGEIFQEVVTYTVTDLARLSLPGVAVSLGVATWPYDAKDASGLIDAADAAMYAAKRAGGKQVFSFKEDFIERRR